MANLKRQSNGSWSIKARGYYTQDTRDSEETIPIINGVINNDFSMVKIIQEGEYSKTQQDEACCDCEIF